MLKKITFLEWKNGRRDKSKWLLSTRTLELSEQTRERWNTSMRKHKPARCKSISVSQGSEAENLKTLGAPREGEGARVSVMFVTGAENTVHLLATPLSYRGEQLLSFTPSRRWRSWHSWWWGISSVQSLRHVRLFATPWTAAHQASLSITKSQSLLKLMSIKSVMPSNHLSLCHPLLLLPSIR